MKESTLKICAEYVAKWNENSNLSKIVDWHLTDEGLVSTLSNGDIQTLYLTNM